jgi:hypothetical protein
VLQQASGLKAAHEAAPQKRRRQEVNEALLLNLGTKSQASRMFRACRASNRVQTFSLPLLNV